MEASRAILKEPRAVSKDKTIVWVVGTRVVIVELESKYGVREEGRVKRGSQVSA